MEGFEEVVFDLTAASRDLISGALLTWSRFDAVNGGSWRLEMDWKGTLTTFVGPKGPTKVGWKKPAEHISRPIWPTMLQARGQDP
ncbi:hypothetical protein Ancab_000127 [Ancistrocladus abbreviatus]